MTSYYGLIAFHYKRAEDLIKAIEYYEMAGELAWQTFVRTEVGYYYEQALELNKKLPIPLENQISSSGMSGRVRVSHWYKRLSSAACFLSQTSKVLR